MTITVTEKEIRRAVIEFLERKGIKPASKDKESRLSFYYRKDDNSVYSSSLEVELD